MGRQVIPLKENFFNDGYWYVLGSSSLGGSHLSPAQIEQALQSNEASTIHQLLQDGICLPLYFPGDCALDDAVVVIGDLTEREKGEWIGRIRSKLEIPCGEFFIMGGGLEEEFEIALTQFEPPDPHYRFFQKVQVDPGSYLVEIYAFLSSMTVNCAWDEMSDEEESIENWWQRTHLGEEYPEWIDSYLEEDYVDSEAHNFLEYIIRLAPLNGDVPLPELDEETQWCGVFELRRPDPCPLGIPRSALVGSR
ncbi:MAG: hypothetical protein AB4040_10680 [Synechococcus sp.]